MSERTDARVAALEEYGIMDTPPEQVFDDLTRLTSFICGTPIALVSLLDQNRQWFKSKVGLDATETPIEMAFCSHAIEDENVFVVPNATEDARFAENPLVTGDPNIRFYAGAPLLTDEGVALGTLCAIDSSPREFSGEQQSALQALARQVMWALEYRRTCSDLIAANEARMQAQQEAEQLRELLPMCSWCRKVRDDEKFWQTVEHYLLSHSEIELTHGMCPECAKKMSPDHKARPDGDGDGTQPD